MGKILVVDDEPSFRLMLERLLRAAGHTVEVATDGHACLKMFRASPFDLVIMDMFMPNKEGLETIIELRKEFPHVAVVAMTGRSEFKVVLQAAKELGAVRKLAGC